VNEAVEHAHRNGVLMAASLMVAGDAAADAVERARRLRRCVWGCTSSWRMAGNVAA